MVVGVPPHLQYGYYAYLACSLLGLIYFYRRPPLFTAIVACMLASAAVVFPQNILTHKVAGSWPSHEYYATDAQCSVRNEGYLRFYMKCNHGTLSLALYLIIGFHVWALVEFLTRQIVRLTSLFDKLGLNEVGKQEEIINKIVCVVHSVYCTGSAGYLFVVGSFADGMWDNFTWYWAPAVEPIVAISTTYFLYDAISMARVEWSSGGAVKVQPALLGHHYVCALGMAYTLFYRMGLPFVIGLMITECTTPFYQLRHFLYSAGLQKAPVYLLNGLVFWLGFLVFRVVLTTIEMYMLVSRREQFWGVYPAHILIPALAVPFLMLLNYWWYFQVTIVVFRAIFRPKQLESKMDKKE